MANINTPAHDFAPPWLKIPTYDSAKPSGAECDRGGHASRKEGHSYGSSRHTKDSDNFAPPRHHFYNDSRRERNTFSGERKPSYLTSYHHSLDFEDSYFEVNSGHSTYTDNSCNGTCNSQSSLLRRPHSRHDFRNIPASYSKGDIFNRHLANNSGGFYSKAKGKFVDSCSSNSNSIFNENGGINASSNNFNQEFPSLQGDISEESTSPPPTVNGGVWEKHRNMTMHGSGAGKKIQLIKKPFTFDTTPESSKKATSLSFPSSSSVVSSSGIPPSISNPHTVIVTPVAKGGGSGIYRALIPAKCTNSTKKPVVIKDTVTKTQPATKKPPSSVAAPSTHSMEILVKHPKAPGNKSEFLKALRNENKSSSNVRKDSMGNKAASPEFGSCTKSQVESSHTNGIDIAKMSISDDGEKPMLSSSLEAEQRLLREMGWKEEVSDDDNYAPLTEDEMREFRALSEQIAKKNGVRRSLQTNFSPRRLAPFSNITLPTDTCSSSSESDSDF